MPICISLLLAYLFNPTLHKTQAKWNWSRPPTAGLIVAATTFLLVAFFIWLWPIAAEQTSTLAEKLPEYIRTAAEQININVEDFNL